MTTANHVKLAFVLAAISVAMSHARAADADGNFTVLSVGTKSCGTIVSDFNKDDWPKLINSVWVGGFITAINSEAHNGKNVAEGIDASARDLWIYNYCKSNPLDSLFRATDALLGELRKRAR